MCLHDNTIDDFTTGDLVCTECGLVIDKIFIPSNKEVHINYCVNELSKINGLSNEALMLNVKDFTHFLNIHHSFVDEIMENVKILLPRFNHFPLPMVIASSCYVVLSNNNSSIALSKLENVVCQNQRDKRNLFKMIVSLRQQNINSNQSENLVEAVLYGLNLSFKEIETIKKNIVELKCKYCTYSPLTVITSHTFLFMKYKYHSATLSSICSHVGITKNSVYSYINERKHNCVKNWYDVYKQLSYR